jgi:hypothetical protein
MADFPLIYEDEVRIYENQAALNRAFVVHEVLKADSYEQAQMIALREGFDPGKTAVIEEEDAPSGIEPVKEMSEAVIKEYGPAKVVVEVDAKEPGVLVLSDLHYPGWRVEVNGEKGSILRVNGLVRGVLVGFLVGSGISLLSVVACLFLVAFRRAHSFAEGPDK